MAETAVLGVARSFIDCLGVQELGQAGSLTDVDGHHELDVRSVVEAGWTCSTPE